ncbi:MAG: hypothetical protein ABW110_11590, partial [Steroidobacteraceae bacterium]
MGPVDVELMLATDYRPFSRDGWIFELKWDGYRVLASKNELITRNKKNATAWYPEIVAVLQDLRGSFILDGEVCVLKEDGLPDFESMRSRTLRRSGSPVTYFAFDLLFQNGRDLRQLPLLERKHRLKELIPRQTPRLQYVDYIEVKGEQMFEHAVAIGMEG